MKVLGKINNKGFTLIELMITVAIVGILAAVALPAYQDYTIRAQVTEGMSLASGQKVAVSEYYSNHGTFPTATQLGFNGAIGKYVSVTEIGENGRIEATFGGEDVNSNLAGRKLFLTPRQTDAGNLEWSCSSDAASKYIPSSCIPTESTGGGNDGENGGGDNGGTTPPAAPPVYNTNTAYSGFTFENGKLIQTYRNITLDLLRTEADGTQVFGNSPNYTAGVEFSISPDGIMSQANPEGRTVQKSYPSELGGGQMTFSRTSSGEDLTKVIVNGGTYAGSTFSTFNAYRTADSDYSAGRTTKAQYDTIVSNFKSELQAVATSNNGGPPAGFPQVYLDYLK